MKQLNEISTSDWVNLTPGEQVESKPERGREFRFVVADGANILPALPRYLTLSVYRVEAREIATVSAFAGIVDGMAQFADGKTNYKSVTVEEAQIRLAPDMAIDVAALILANVAPTMLELIKQKLSAYPALTPILTDA